MSDYSHQLDELERVATEIAANREGMSPYEQLRADRIAEEIDAFFDETERQAIRLIRRAASVEFDGSETTGKEPAAMHGDSIEGSRGGENRRGDADLHAVKHASS